TVHIAALACQSGMSPGQALGRERWHTHLATIDFGPCGEAVERVELGSRDTRRAFLTGAEMTPCSGASVRSGDLSAETGFPDAVRTHCRRTMPAVRRRPNATGPARETGGNQAQTSPPRRDRSVEAGLIRGLTARC